MRKETLLILLQSWLDRTNVLTSSKVYGTDEGERIQEDTQQGTGERGVELRTESEPDIVEVGVEER